MQHSFLLSQPVARPRAGLFWVRHGLVRLARWQQLARERESLRHLDERTLRDIGVSRHEALKEARRPFWDEPAR